MTGAVMIYGATGFSGRAIASRLLRGPAWPDVVLGRDGAAARPPGSGAIAERPYQKCSSCKIPKQTALKLAGVEDVLSTPPGLILDTAPR